MLPPVADIGCHPGNILYDPLRSISSFAGKAGLAIGFLTAWIPEEKYIAFRTENLTVAHRIIRAVIGILLHFVMAIIAAGVDRGGKSL